MTAAAGMAEIIVEIGFAGPDTSGLLILDDPVRGLLNTGQLAADLAMVDVSADVLGFTTRRGATRADGPVLRYEAGTATLDLGVTDRRYDPTNLDGPYVVAGQSEVGPMRPVRIRATWDGVTYPVMTAYTDDFVTTYEDPQWVQVSVPCTDAFVVFQSNDRAAVAAVGAGETTGARVERILDSISWPADARDVAAGQTTVQATDLAGAALAELQLVAETELGEFYIDTAGDAYFRGRDGVLTDARSTTSQATFGDDGSELPYETVVLDTASGRQLVNQVRIARAGGAEQAVDDATSIARYLTRTYRRSGLLMEADDEALNYASFVLYQGRSAEVRIASMTIDPRTDPDQLWPQVLGRRIGDRITVRKRPPGGGDPLERDVFIRGIGHRFTRETWLTTWVFQSATRFSFLVLDDPVLGVLDANALAY